MEPELPVINYADRETHYGPEYYFDNAHRSRRGGPKVWVIQRTESGRAFLENHAGRWEVDDGKAMLFIYGEKSRYGYPPGETRPYGNAFLNLQGDGFQPLFESLRLRFGPVIPLPGNSPAETHFQEAVDARIHQTFRDRYQEAEWIYRFLLTWLRDLSESPGRLNPAQHLYESLRNHYHRPFSLKEFANQHQVSREHLSRLFKTEYGIAPGGFLRQTRMQQARTLLETTSLGIGQVGAQCGYPDLNVFSRTFRRTFGVSPAKARRNY